MVSTKFKCLQSNRWVVLWCHVFLRKTGGAKVSRFHCLFIIFLSNYNINSSNEIQQDLILYPYPLPPYFLLQVTNFLQVISKIDNNCVYNCKRNIAFSKQPVIRKTVGGRVELLVEAQLKMCTFSFFFNLQMPLPVI